jgi:hypothetical protein
VALFRPHAKAFHSFFEDVKHYAAITKTMDFPEDSFKQEILQPQHVGRPLFSVFRTYGSGFDEDNILGALKEARTIVNFVAPYFTPKDGEIFDWLQHNKEALDSMKEVSESTRP